MANEVTPEFWSTIKESFTAFGNQNPQYSVYVNEFLEKYHPNFNNPNVNYQKDFYTYILNRQKDKLKDCEKEIIPICENILKKNAKSERINLSLLFAQYLMAFMNILVGPMAKGSSDNSYDYPKDELVELIKSAKEILDFGNARTSLHQLVFVKSADLKITNRKTNSYFKFQTRNNYFLFQFDNKFRKNDFTFELGTPEFIDISIPSDKSYPKIDFDKLKLIYEKLVSVVNFTNKFENTFKLVSHSQSILDKNKDHISSDRKKINEYMQIKSRIDEMELLLSEVDLPSKINSILKSPNVCQSIYDYGQNNLVIMTLNDDFQIANFTKIDLYVPTVSENQKKPIEIVIKTDNNQLLPQISGPRIFSVSRINYDIILRINTLDLQTGYQELSATLSFGKLSFPVYLDVNKINLDLYVKVDGCDLLYDKDHNKILVKKLDETILVTTYNSLFERIPHKITTDNESNLQIDYYEEDKETEVTVKNEIDASLAITANSTKLDLHMYNEMDRTYLFLFYNRYSREYKQPETYLYAGLLGYRYFFYANSVLDDPKDYLIAEYSCSETIYIKEFRLQDNVVSFDISFTEFAKDDGSLDITITTKKKAFKKVHHFDIVFADIDFKFNGDDICFQPIYEELDDMQCVFYNENHKWESIKANEYIPCPPRRLIVVTPFTYRWIQLDDEYNADVIVDFNDPRIIPDYVKNFAIFAVEGNKYKIVMEEEFNKETMKKVAIRICDDPYDPNEPKDMWYNTWTPVETTMDYLYDAFKNTDNNAFFFIIQKLIEFIKFVPDHYHDVYKRGSRRDLMDLIVDVFTKRYSFIKASRYQLRMPIKIDDIFIGQNLMTTKNVFSPLVNNKYNKIIANAQKKAGSSRPNLSKYPFKALYISNNTVTKFDSDLIDENVPESVDLDLGDDMINPVNIGIENLQIPDLMRDANNNSNNYFIILSKFIPVFVYTARKYMHQYNAVHPNILYIYSFLTQIVKCITSNTIILDKKISEPLKQSYDTMSLLLGQTELTETNKLVNIPASEDLKTQSKPLVIKITDDKVYPSVQQEKPKSIIRDQPKTVPQQPMQTIPQNKPSVSVAPFSFNAVLEEEEAKQANAKQENVRSFNSLLEEEEAKQANTKPENVRSFNSLLEEEEAKQNTEQKPQQIGFGSVLYGEPPQVVNNTPSSTIGFGSVLYDEPKEQQQQIGFAPVIKEEIKPTETVQQQIGFAPVIKEEIKPVETVHQQIGFAPVIKDEPKLVETVQQQIAFAPVIKEDPKPVQKLKKHGGFDPRKKQAAPEPQVPDSLQQFVNPQQNEQNKLPQRTKSTEVVNKRNDYSFQPRRTSSQEMQQPQQQYQNPAFGFNPQMYPQQYPYGFGFQQPQGAQFAQFPSPFNTPYGAQPFDQSAVYANANFAQMQMQQMYMNQYAGFGFGYGAEMQQNQQPNQQQGFGFSNQYNQEYPSGFGFQGFQKE